MGMIAIVASVVTLIIGIYVNQSKPQNHEVLSQTSEQVEATSEPTIPEPTDTPVATNSPTLSPTIMPTAASVATTATGKINNFLYPGMSVSSQTNTKLGGTTSDQSKIVTDWYKSKIKELGFNTNSAALTSTNGNVINKLASANREYKVAISITKNSEETSTHIDIEIE